MSYFGGVHWVTKEYTICSLSQKWSLRGGRFPYGVALCVFHVLKNYCEGEKEEERLDFFEISGYQMGIYLI